MKVDVYNQKNEKAGEMELPERIFGQKWNPDLVHQTLQAQLANRRQILAHAKGRGEVRGGGRKPWRQKGTGRARHGSIRSPLWKGGGVTFGPLKEKVFSKKINKKMRQLAVWTLLSRKLKEGFVKVIDDLDINEFKTKNLALILKGWGVIKDGALIVPSIVNKKIKKAAVNIPKIDALSPQSLNVYDVLRFKNLIIEKEAIKEIEEHYKI